MSQPENILKKLANKLAGTGEAPNAAELEGHLDEVLDAEFFEAIIAAHASNHGNNHNSRPDMQME